jgi:hypothetical protein
MVAGMTGMPALPSPAKISKPGLAQLQAAGIGLCHEANCQMARLSAPRTRVRD